MSKRTCESCALWRCFNSHVRHQSPSYACKRAHTKARAHCARTDGFMHRQQAHTYGFNHTHPHVFVSSRRCCLSRACRRRRRHHARPDAVVGGQQTGREVPCVPPMALRNAIQQEPLMRSFSSSSSFFFHILRVTLSTNHAKLYAHFLTPRFGEI
jgi:hypothetical protein